MSDRTTASERQPPAEGREGEIGIRPMRAEDLSRVMETERASFTMPWTEATFRGLLDRDDADLIVAELDGRLVGHAICWSVLDQGELGNIAVAPGRRGAGIGTRLLHAIFECATRRGVRDLYLEVRVSNEQAQALYRRHGFDSVGRRRKYYLHPVEDALVMRKRLDPADDRPQR